ncbi:hypothetical protein BHE74_00045378, partial [Ensete ventricosum]
ERGKEGWGVEAITASSWRCFLSFCPCSLHSIPQSLVVVVVNARPLTLFRFLLLLLLLLHLEISSPLLLLSLARRARGSTADPAAGLGFYEPARPARSSSGGDGEEPFRTRGMGDAGLRSTQESF